MYIKWEYNLIHKKKLTFLLFYDISGTLALTLDFRDKF